MLGFIIGIVLCSGVVYGSNIYPSNAIEYSPTDETWEVSNVNEAINSLYSMKTELENIKSIGDATAAQILSGKYAVVKGSTVTGSMTNRGAWTNTPTGSGKVTIPAGYHNGSGYVNTATAYTNGYNAGVVASNKTFSSNGSSSGTIAANAKVTTSYPPYAIILSKYVQYSSSYESMTITYIRDGSAFGYRNYHDSYNNTDSLSNLSPQASSITWYDDGFKLSEYAGYSYTVYY